MRRLIRGARIVTMDPAIGDFGDGDVLIDGSTIEYVGPQLDAVDAEVIDASGAIALPGLVECHRHVWQGLIRCAVSGATGAQYFNAALGQYGAKYTPEDAHLGESLGLAEAAYAGITTVLDWSHLQNSPAHTDAMIAASRESGLRTIFCYGPPCDDPIRWWHDSSAPHPADARRVRDVLADDAALVTMAFGLRGPEITSWEIVEGDLAMARELGLRSHVHVGSPARRAADAVRRLARRDLLQDDLTFVMANALDDEEFELIRAAGATMTTSPEFAMQTGWGFPPISRMIAHGLRPGLGSDALGSYGGSLFSLMRLTAQTSQMLAWSTEGGSSMSDLDVLSLVTTDAATALGMEHRIGSISPGKSADLILLDRTVPSMFPLTDPIGLVVKSADVSAVRDVLVAGKFVKRDGVLTNVDTALLRRQAESAWERLHAARLIGES